MRKTYYLTTPIENESSEFKSTLETIKRTCNTQQNLKETVVRGYDDEGNTVIVATFMCYFDALAYIETTQESNI